MSKKENILRLLKRAVALHQAGKLDEAATLYQSVLNSDPQNIDALRLLGTICYQRNDNQEAIRLIDLSLKNAPIQPEAFNNKGISLNRMGRYQEALTCFESALPSSIRACVLSSTNASTESRLRLA